MKKLSGIFKDKYIYYHLCSSKYIISHSFQESFWYKAKTTKECYSYSLFL